uniref:Uncharacterized protein n=1 Tax=Anguilla anguilla TaxID=7936 RepID=A0A0E9UFD6_ANGAN
MRNRHQCSLVVK